MRSSVERRLFTPPEVETIKTFCEYVVAQTTGQGILVADLNLPTNSSSEGWLAYGRILQETLGGYSDLLLGWEREGRLTDPRLRDFARGIAHVVTATDAKSTEQGLEVSYAQRAGAVGFLVVQAQIAVIGNGECITYNYKRLGTIPAEDGMLKQYYTVGEMILNKPSEDAPGLLARKQEDLTTQPVASDQFVALPEKGWRSEFGDYASLVAASLPPIIHPE